jgi:hypothetical protein
VLPLTETVMSTNVCVVDVIVITRNVL